jgi:hypothetical protein
LRALWCGLPALTLKSTYVVIKLRDYPDEEPQHGK